MSSVASPIEIHVTVAAPVTIPAFIAFDLSRSSNDVLLSGKSMPVGTEDRFCEWIMAEVCSARPADELVVHLYF